MKRCKLLLIDNFDSFIYNLHYDLELLGAEVTVCRNDVAFEQMATLIEASDGIVLSPGPGKPSDAGLCLEVIRHYRSRKPILGICLGHQAIVEALGGVVGASAEMMHGKTSALTHNSSALFTGLEQASMIARYHSLEALEVPEELSVDARSESGAVMAVSSADLLYGLQFHPESIMSKQGTKMLTNYIEVVEKHTNKAQIKGAK